MQFRALGSRIPAWQQGVRTRVSRIRDAGKTRFRAFGSWIHALVRRSYPLAARMGASGSRLVTPLAMLVLLLLAVAPLPRFVRFPTEASRVLALAYPEAVAGLRVFQDDWAMYFRDGSAVICKDRRRLPFERRLESMDLASILAQSYPFGRVPLPVPEGQEAGRLRNYALLKAAYGVTQDEVQANLEIVDFLGDEVLFNRRNGAADALRSVVREIPNDPEALTYARYIANIRSGKTRNGLHRGTYISGWNWRPIEGTGRLSAHSFGIAIDINNPAGIKPKYWLWAARKMSDRGEAGKVEIDEVPGSLVDIFERHGFIWGGKWHHFDTMHFEYRPEFKLAAGISSRRGSAGAKAAGAEQEKEIQEPWREAENKEVICVPVRAMR